MADNPKRNKNKGKNPQPIGSGGDNQQKKQSASQQGQQQKSKGHQSSTGHQHKSEQLKTQQQPKQQPKQQQLKSQTLKTVWGQPRGVQLPSDASGSSVPGTFSAPVPAWIGSQREHSFASPPSPFAAMPPSPFASSSFGEMSSTNRGKDDYSSGVRSESSSFGVISGSYSGISSSSSEPQSRPSSSASKPSSAKQAKKMEAQISSLSLTEPEQSFKFDNYAKKSYGTLGKKMELVTNYFRMQVQPKIIFHYNIEIIPLDTSNAGDQGKAKKVVRSKRIPKEINFVVFDQLWSTNRNIFKSEPVFDGEKNLYTIHSLDFTGYEKNFQVQIIENDGARKSMFRVRITTPEDSHQIDLNNINKVSSTDFKVSETQALDIILKNGPRRFKLSIGMNLFLRTIDLKKLDDRRRENIRRNLGENKEMAFGFYQSARMTESGLMLNIDRAAIVFNKGGPIIRIIEEMLSDARSSYNNRVVVRVDENFRFDERDKKFIESELKTLKMQVNHIPYRPKFGIHRLSQEAISRVFFEENQADGKKKRTSVYDYFNRTYTEYLQRNRIRLNPNLPAIQVGRERPKYFPLEVCDLVDDQHSTKKLKAKLQADMTRFAGQQKPYERFNEIKSNLHEMIADNKRDKKDFLGQFGVKVDTEFVKVQARVLPQPYLQYRDQAPFNPGTDGAWDMVRKGQLFNTSNELGSNWMIVNVATGQRGRFAGCKRETLDRFAQSLMKKANEMGLKMDVPCFIEYNYQYKGRKTIQKDLFEYFMNKYKNLKLMVCFIPKIDEIYHDLKTAAELKSGLITQCISQDNERKCTDYTFVANVLLKINAKLQGVNVILESKCRPLLLTKATMIVGLDVTHPAPADKLSQSIAACVGTYDKHFCKYYARVVVQPKPKKEIVDLASMMFDLLSRFQQVNKRLPSYIVIYRDGVSEGQFDEVMVKELGMLKQSFSKFKLENGETYRPQVAFLVVQKRNHTRFMCADPSKASRSGNVHPGTVVDRTITSNVLFDFYVVAHQGMIGTSRPVHYYLLYNEIPRVDADEFEKMTYYLSYLYPRCTRSISVPPPVMYAHLSAKRARSHIFIMDESDGHSTVSSGSNGQYRQLSAAETEDMNKKLMVRANLNGALYYI